MPGAALPSRSVLAQRGKRLAYFTIVWNLLEAVVGVAAGVVAGSISLVGFGTDSLVEVTSGAAVLWRMAVDADAGRRERNERISLRIVGACFLALALYIAVDAAWSLVARQAAARSPAGIALACASLVVMPLLARGKRRVAAGLASAAMRADARQTDFCVYLSGILLAGLGANALWGWWWADPAAALAMVPIIAHEGIKALRRQPCQNG